MTYFFVGQYYMLDPFLVTGCLDYLQNRQTSAATTNIIVILGNSTSTKMTLADTCKLVPASKVYLQQCKTSAIWMQNSQLAVTKLCMCNVHFNNHWDIGASMHHGSERRCNTKTCTWSQCQLSLFLTAAVHLHGVLCGWDLSRTARHSSQWQMDHQPVSQHNKHTPPTRNAIALWSHASTNCWTM